MTLSVSSWLANATKNLPAIDAELITLFCFAPLHSDRSWLILHSDDLISDAAQQKARELSEARLSGTPLAYLLGYREFYGRNFRVNPNVLIPRPETESLIELVKELPLPQHSRILEIGTGSGCIAITLSLEFPAASVTATDISPSALEVARSNASALNASVQFLQSDLLSNLSKDVNFDVIIANLPYVDPEWTWLDKTSLSFEPFLALYADKHGLALYRRLFEELLEHPISSFLALEADPCQHDELISMATNFSWQHLQTQGFGLTFRKTSN